MQSNSLERLPREGLIRQSARLPTFLFSHYQIEPEGEAAAVAQSQIVTLHRSHTATARWLLLKKAGIPLPEGFYSRFKEFLTGCYYSESLFDLALEVWERSPDAQNFFISGDMLWFLAAFSELARGISESGLGLQLGLPFANGDPLVRSKTEFLQGVAQENRDFEYAFSPTKQGYRNPQKVPLTETFDCWLVEEAHRVAGEDGYFDAKVFRPFCKQRKRLFSLMKRDKNAQLTYFLPDGIHTTGQSRKLPKGFSM